MEIIQNFIPKGRPNRPGNVIEVEFVTAHNTGDPGATDEQEAEYQKGDDCANREASWQLQVDDNSITQSMPVGPGITEEAFHAADGFWGPGNHRSVAIEICEVGTGATLIERALSPRQQKANDNAAQLAAYLLKMFNKPLANVRQHHDWYNKDCPRLLRATPDGWANWLRLISYYMQSATPVTLIDDPDRRMQLVYDKYPWLGAQRYAALQAGGKYKLLFCQYGTIWTNLEDKSADLWPAGDILGQKLQAAGEVVRL